MTMHSHYWKKDLLKRADTLSDKVTHIRWGEEARMILEQVLVLGFHSIQKLLQENLISDKTKNNKIAIKKFPSIIKDDTVIRSPTIADLYNLEKSSKSNQTILFLCHQFIQPRFIEFYYDKDNHPQGLYITSEHNKKKAIFEIELSQVISIFSDVGNDSLAQL